MVLISTLHGDFQKGSGYPHSTNEEAEEQKRKVICPHSCRSSLAEIKRVLV